jgi:DNA polymerase-3 subunit chi
MTKVDFYIIPETEKNLALRFVCRKIEALYAEPHRIYIHLDTLEETQQFNDLLWTFHDISFIPHEIVGENKNAPIKIGYQQKPQDINAILINLSEQIPNFYQEFKQIIEIVPEIEEWKKTSRIKFQAYKKNKDEIQSIKQ